MSATNFDTAFKTVQRLVSEFHQHEPAFLASSYSEAEARKDFIDKFWIALGWDVNHEEQVDPYRQEVKVERSVNDNSSRRRADYAILADNFADVMFFIEAKKPSRGIDNLDDYFQTIRYGWNGGTPLSVLMDFQTLRVLDCRYKPEIETALSRVVRKYHYQEYAQPDKFREIYHLFSREAVRNNSIRHFAETQMPKPVGRAVQRGLFPGGGQSIDESFLEEMDGYREELARSFKACNHHLTAPELTEITQRTLDRLVFIRFLEDKQIETEPIIETLGTKSSVWGDFIAASAKLNRIYNGIIFKPHAILDSPQFKVDEEVMARIRESLAHTNSPYDFNVIPIHIIGSIYERFLGKVIEITGKRVFIKEKESVRKAGGVFYTPQYIVRRIVNDTVGKLLVGKRPDEVKKLRFADIACGSGSFLLEVYDLLLRHCTEWYNRTKKNREKGRKAGCVFQDNRLVLSLRQKIDILISCVYGVDIDTQAVEMAQLSLYLKLLESETTYSTHAYQQSFKSALLPSLNQNIISGNSLIGYEFTSPNLFADEEERRINAMDFASCFPSVFREGGFHAIIGNPPYGAEIGLLERTYLKRKYKLGTTDTAALMMVQSLNLTRSGGEVGLIVPKPLIYSSTWEKTRDALLPHLYCLIDAGKVWKEVKLEQVICLLSKATSPDYVSVKREQEQFFLTGKVEKTAVREFNFYLNGLSSQEVALGRKIRQAGAILGSLVTNERGGMFQNLITEDGDGYKVIGGRNIQRYRVEGCRGTVRKDADLPENSFFREGSILVQNIVAHIANPIDHIKITACLVTNADVAGSVILDTVNQLRNHSDQPSHYLLALLNSRLINWYTYRFIFAKAIRTMHFDDTSAGRIPVKLLKGRERCYGDQVKEIVDQMEAARRQLFAALTDRDRSFLERKVSSLQQQMDEIVYQLYDLDEKERILIEAATPPHIA
ncbi:MAG: DNA methyltransferase [Blastocatellia bacterium]